MGGGGEEAEGGRGEGAECHNIIMLTGLDQGGGGGGGLIAFMFLVKIFQNVNEGGIEVFIIHYTIISRSKIASRTLLAESLGTRLVTKITCDM